MKLFNQDMKHYKAPEEATTLKSICWSIVAIVSLIVILGKMEEDKISFVAEQFIKHQDAMK